jgi:hypothetical protein
VVLASTPAASILHLSGGDAVLRLASVCYVGALLLTLRLPQPAVPAAESVTVTSRGRVPNLTTPAAGAAGLRGASGFLLFLLAFALRTGGQPRWWFGVLAASAVAGGFLADLVAPRLPKHLPEEGIVLGSVAGAGVAAAFAAVTFHLWALAAFAVLVGMATEFGRLAFQALMQRSAPGGAQGRVFVRYEVVFQLAWVGGAFLPALLPIPFRAGVISLAVFYVILAVAFVMRSGTRGGEHPA